VLTLLVYQGEGMDLRELVSLAAGKKATDVFLTADAFPAFRIRGEVEFVNCLPRLSSGDCMEMAYGIMTTDQIGKFERQNDLDLSFVVPDVAKVRANIYRQRESVALALRIMRVNIPSLGELNLPSSIADMLKHREGLILVTGPTGSGKSTTLASMVREINESRKCHIVTVEDPIEYNHSNIKSVVSQRQIGADVDSFQAALRYVLRQNPDVILVGEMRDVETVHVAMSAAETGHLVLSTLHTSSASETLERLMGMFPPHERAYVGIRLSSSLRGIISQRLVNKADGNGVMAATEILIGTPSISGLLAEGQASSIHDAIAEGAFWGMRTMNQCLIDLVSSNTITIEEAEANSPNGTEFKQLMRRNSGSTCQKDVNEQNAD